MQIRVAIGGGSAQIETISILEDLWHDFEYFKSRAARLERPGATTGDQLKAKRYQRAAVVMLAFYFEGVINEWLNRKLPREEFDVIERKPLEVKVQRLLGLAGSMGKPPLKANAAKQIRNKLAHLKPGQDLSLFDGVSKSSLLSSETMLIGWLAEMEQVLKVSRHPDTEAQSSGLYELI